MSRTPHTHADIFQILGIPNRKSRPWFIGYSKHGGAHYLFCGVATPGRTGFNLHNNFNSPDLFWRRKPKSCLSWPRSHALVR